MSSNPAAILSSVSSRRPVCPRRQRAPQRGRRSERSGENSQLVRTAPVALANSPEREQRGPHQRTRSRPIRPPPAASVPSPGSRACTTSPSSSSRALCSHSIRAFHRAISASRASTRINRDHSRGSAASSAFRGLLQIAQTPHTGEFLTVDHVDQAGHVAWTAKSDLHVQLVAQGGAGEEPSIQALEVVHPLIGGLVDRAGAARRAGPAPISPAARTYWSRLNWSNAE